VCTPAQLTGHFPDSQDQRHTLRARIRYQLTSRLWLSGGGEYGSGLPFEFTGNINQALFAYGEQVIGRIDFAAGRIKPTLSLDLSAGADLYRKEKRSVRLQADAENLNNRLNVLDFAGLFSASAIAPPRSYFLRLAATF
jgi:hypothetical protein